MISLTIRSKQDEGDAMLHTRIKIDGKAKWINLQLPVSMKKMARSKHFSKKTD